jgi:signal transduction histidine kinase
LLLGRLEDSNKEIKDLREELSDMDPNTIRSKSLSERIQKLTAEMAEINRLIDEID